MSCTQVRSFLAAYHDDMLPSARRDHVRAHVMTCVDCREILESYDALYAALRAAPAPHVSPTLARDVYARIAALDALEGRRRRPVFGASLRALGGTAGVLAVLTGLAAAVLQLGRPAEAPLVSAQDAASHVRAVWVAVHQAKVGQLPRSEQTAVAPASTVLAGGAALMVRSSKATGSNLTVYSDIVEAPDGGAPRGLVPLQMQVGRTSSTDGRAVVKQIVSGTPTPIATLDPRAGLAYLHLDNANALRANDGNSPAQVEWHSFAARTSLEVLATPIPAGNQLFTGLTANPLDHSVYYSALGKAPLGGIFRINTDTEALSVTQVVSLGTYAAPSPVARYVKQVYDSSDGSLLFTVIDRRSVSISTTATRGFTGTTPVPSPWYDYVESPDHAHIAWTLNPDADGGFGTLTVAPIAGAAPTSIVASGAAHPLWSPDGSYLLYRRRGARNGLYIWSLRTHTARRVVDEPVNGVRSISGDVWSPDSRYIAYVLSQPDGSGATSTVYLCDTTTNYAWPTFSRRFIGAVTWAEGPARSTSAAPAHVAVATAPPSSSTVRSTFSASTASPMTLTNPGSVLRSYYVALNAHDFGAAFALLDKPDQYDFARFAGGFADTLSDTILTVRPALNGTPVQGDALICVGVAFMAHRQGGAVVRYGGWYALRQAAKAGPREARWRIAVSHSHIVEGGQATTPSPALCH